VLQINLKTVISELGVSIMEQMDLNNLRLLIQVVQCGSLGRAQKELGIAKSTLSRRLTQFESQLNLKLVERELSGIMLTDAGRRLIAEASPLIKELNNVEDMLAGLHKVPRGHLSISVPLEFGINFLSPIVSQYSAMYPEVEVSIDVSQERRDLSKDNIDVALRFGLRSEDDKYIAKELAPIRSSLYCSPDYFEKYQPDTAINKLSAYPCVCSRTGEHWNFVVKGEVVKQPVFGRYFASSTTFKRDAVIAGIGIGLIPDFLCREALKQEQLIKLNFQAEPLTISFYAVYQPSSFKNPKLYRFLELMQKELPKIYRD